VRPSLAPAKEAIGVAQLADVDSLRAAVQTGAAVGACLGSVFGNVMSSCEKLSLDAVNDLLEAGISHFRHTPAPQNTGPGGGRHVAWLGGRGQHRLRTAA
jgi:hypothetical protein